MEQSQDAIPFREKLRECLGGPWPEPPALDARVREVGREEGYRIERVEYQAELGETIPSYALIPDGADPGMPRPAIAVWHQHNDEFELGKSEPAGLAGNPMHHTGAALAQEGYIVLCPDALGFEERRDSVLAGPEFERFLFLKYVVQGRCLAWKNILDMRRAIDYLCSRQDVDPDRIGCYGHSLGSTFTWLVGPWEPRLRCLVGNCCLPSYAAIHRVHLLHSFSNFVPGLLQYGDTPDVAALIAPRPLHLNFGALDEINPVPEVRQAVARIRLAYQALGADGHFTALIEEGQGHVLSPRMWELVREKFRRYLPLGPGVG